MIDESKPLRRYEAFDAAGFRWKDRTSYRQGDKDPQPDMWETLAGRLKISVGVRSEGWFVWCRLLHIERRLVHVETPQQAAQAAIALILDLLILDVATLQSSSAAVPLGSSSILP